MSDERDIDRRTILQGTGAAAAASLFPRTVAGAVEAGLGEREYASFVGCIREEVMDGWTGARKLRRAAEPVIGSRRVDRIDAAVDDLESVADVLQFAKHL